MANLIVYIDRSTVHDGRLDELKSAMAALVDFVEANEPEILAYNVYFSEDGNRMTVMHMHADSSTLAYHLEVAGGEFAPIGELIELESIDVYGPLDTELVEELRAKAASLGSGRVAVHPFHRGLERVVTD